MFEFQPLHYTDKNAFYRQLLAEIEPMLETTWFTNLANISAAIMAHLPRLIWAGFYLNHQDELILGPFQGLPACLRIPFSKGVCGAAARTRSTQMVADVHAFPGHIACDARSRSEIVIPMVANGRVVGVLDLDSPELARFDDQDKAGLEEIVRVLMSRTTWPTDFI